MNPETETRSLSDEAAFELLEHPERWPEDPAQQAQLAELLELHLALQAHGSALAAGQPTATARPARRSLHAQWMLAAAALLCAVIPTVLAIHRSERLRQIARDQAHIQEAAQRRSQGRLWAAFFQQSSELLKQFDRNPPLCKDDNEDRSQERMVATLLLEASHQLAAQGAPVPEAEQARTELHGWLTELTVDEGCLRPERVQELRQLAAAQDLEGQAKRLGSLLKGEGS